MRGDLDVILKNAPAAVRRAMIEDAPNLAPGAAHVMGRFWSAVRAGKGNPSMPAAEAYRSAAASESTFRCLLRALAAYAPHVCTAPARVVSDEWYARRPQTGCKGCPDAEQPVGASWPVSWRRMKPELDAAPIKISTRKRYIASIDRCAAVVAEGLASDTHGFVAACELSEAFLFHPDEEPAREARHGCQLHRRADCPGGEGRRRGGKPDRNAGHHCAIFETRPRWRRRTSMSGCPA